MMARQKPEPVCPPDCRERAPGCHGRCERYMSFRREKEKEYQKRKSIAKMNGYAIDAYKTCRHESPYPAGCRKHRGDKK